MPKSDPSQFAAAATANLAAALKPSMEALGKDVQAEMRSLVSVPVEYVDPDGSTRPATPDPIGSKPGPGLTHRDTESGGIHFTTVGGKLKRIIRSKRGEAPRKEFGNLYKSMVTWTEASPGKVTMYMGSDDDIAGYSDSLENRLDRPHFKTIFERLQRYAVGRILSRAPNVI